MVFSEGHVIALFHDSPSEIQANCTTSTWNLIHDHYRGKENDGLVWTSIACILDPNYAQSPHNHKGLLSSKVPHA